MDRSIKATIKLLQYVYFDFDGIITDNKVYVKKDGSEFVDVIWVMVLD